MSLLPSPASQFKANTGLPQVQCAKNTKTRFSFFPKLPAELQLTIWEWAVAEPRIVYADVCDSKHGWHKPRPLTYIKGVPYQQVPDLFFVSRQARGVVAMRYNIHFQMNFESRDLGWIRSSCYFMMAEDDMVFLTDFLPPTFGGDFKKIKNLLIHVQQPWDIDKVDQLSTRRAMFHPESSCFGTCDYLGTCGYLHDMGIRKRFFVLIDNEKDRFMPDIHSISYSDIKKLESLPNGRVACEKEYGANSPKVQEVLDKLKVLFTENKLSHHEDQDDDIVYLISPGFNPQIWKKMCREYREQRSLMMLQTISVTYPWNPRHRSLDS
ncbi:hypothetical protein F5X96DRAFT_666180 [Biscogniauxia mediterranea]|nr:hypothetical protein F5X96DRAFT_666180 [Biscogniauxia mediterranea]